jgi:hypothetical protein
MEKITVQVRMKWWVHPFIYVAAKFAMVMGLFGMEEHHADALGSKMGKFIAGHGVRFVFK